MLSVNKGSGLNDGVMAIMRKKYTWLTVRMRLLANGCSSIQSSVSVPARGGELFLESYYNTVGPRSLPIVSLHGLASCFLPDVFWN